MTSNEKYGVDHHLKSEDIINKRRQTLLDNNQISHLDGQPLFDYFADKIRPFEHVSRDPNNREFLNVLCEKCDRWFMPSMSQLGNRIQAFNGNRGYAQNNFYCSKECKDSCAIFGKQLYQEDHPQKLEEIRDPIWSKMVKERANFECEKCGNVNNLVAHHTKPVKGNEILANDIDNGICVCENCHKEMHQIDGCKTNELARKVC